MYRSFARFRTLETGFRLQRLFSTFPDGQPGLGLLLLRVGAAFPLIYFGISGLTASEPHALVLRVIVIAGGFLLLVGLWTPIAGIAVALGQVWNTLSPGVSEQEGPWIGIVLAVLSAGVALLGPGAWSVDAHLFGRRRFEIDGRKRRR